MPQTVVSLSSSYTELFWNTSCFFQRGQSSGIATKALSYCVTWRTERHRFRCSNPFLWCPRSVKPLVLLRVQDAAIRGTTLPNAPPHDRKTLPQIWSRDLQVASLFQEPKSAERATWQLGVALRNGSSEISRRQTVSMEIKSLQLAPYVGLLA